MIQKVAIVDLVKASMRVQKLYVLLQFLAMHKGLLDLVDHFLFLLGQKIWMLRI